MQFLKHIQLKDLNVENVHELYDNIISSKQKIEYSENIDEELGTISKKLTCGDFSVIEESQLRVNMVIHIWDFIVYKNDYLVDVEDNLDKGWLYDTMYQKYLKGI